MGNLSERQRQDSAAPISMSSLASSSRIDAMKICCVLAIVYAIDIARVVTNPMMHESNKDKAIAVLQSLQSGDADALRSYVSADGYEQHNLDLPSGRDVLINALPDLKKNGTRVDIRRVIVDGVHVALHSDYNFFGEKVGFDVFRFDNGKVVEHWDNVLTTAR